MLKEFYKFILISLMTCSFNSAYADDVEKVDDPISWNFDFTSNYIWSGMSQSSNDPAVQAGLTYTFDSGFYVSAWGSNVNFTDVNGHTAALELDSIIGYGGEVTDDLTYDLSLLRYNYPGSDGLNYNELIFTGRYQILYATVGYSNDEYHSGKQGVRYLTGINYEIPENLISVSGLAISGEFGHFDLPSKVGPSYNYYHAAISKTFKNDLKIQLLWAGTNGHAQMSPFDKNRLVATIGMNF